MFCCKAGVEDNVFLLNEPLGAFVYLFVPLKEDTIPISKIELTR